MDKLIARKANIDDISKILELQSKYLYSINKDLLDDKSGLINNELSFNDIKKCIDCDDSIVLLLENSNKDIYAYTISIGLKHLRKTKQKLIQIVRKNNNQRNINDVLLIEHIIIHKKTGTLILLNALFNTAKIKYKHVCGEIMTFPIINKVSKKFFTILKGKIIGSIKYKDNTVWDVYYSPIYNDFKDFIC